MIYYYFNNDKKEFKSLRAVVFSAMEFLVKQGKTFENFKEELNSTVLLDENYQELEKGKNGTKRYSEGFFIDKNKNKFYVSTQWGKNGTSEGKWNKFIEYCSNNNLEIIENQDTEKASGEATMTPLNQILYGPPGTGKTYSTVGHALDILEATKKQRKNIKSIGKLKTVFRAQVEFVTFHQSFSYEDFVEGLKANTDNGELSYAVESGVFKQICEQAKSSGNNFDDAYQQLTQQITKNDNQLLTLKTINGNEFFVNVNSKGNLTLHTSEDKNPQGVLTKENIYKEFSGEVTIEGWKSYFKMVVKYLKDKFGLNEYQETADKNPHVLIIDEINRGNISRIFGELITLIEPSKRAGADEEISVQLPYSKELFSVPNNLYIIGTMNTADRSLTMMDTALRRRFDFVEMLPEVSLVTGGFDGIKVGEILKTINQRIEILYDKEHSIGHSFLMGVNDFTALKQAFKNKILPLLEEYFYDDFEKIRKVLNDKGSKFYKKIKIDNSLFFGDESIVEKDIYERADIDKLTAEDFKQIYAKNNQQNNNDQ